jgi:hypothetical protein
MLLVKLMSKIQRKQVVTLYYTRPPVHWSSGLSKCTTSIDGNYSLQISCYASNITIITPIYQCKFDEHFTHQILHHILMMESCIWIWLEILGRYLA